MLEVIDAGIVGPGIAIGMFAGILVAIALGRRMGLRVLARGGSPGTGVGSLETAVFALLGLLIAFTFSGALNRFDTRRGQAVDEANAIGTAWLRIDLLPSSAQPKVRDAMRAYVDARIATYKKLPDLEAARAEAARSSQLQSQVWAFTMEAIRLPEARPGAELLLVPALNQMFDLATVRLMATKLHPPSIIYVMLLGLALAAALLAGYQSAGEKVRDAVQRLGFAAMFAFTIYVILDLEYPRLGFIRIDAIDQVLVDTRAGMR